MRSSRGDSLLVVVMLSFAARANPYFDEGRRSFDALQFRKAITQLEVARRVPPADEAERGRVLDLLARAYLAEGRTADAQGAWAEWLSHDPNATIDADSAPKVRDAFEAARRQVFQPDYFVLRELPSPAGTVRVEVLDPFRRAAQLEVFVRPANADAFTSLTMLLVPGVNVVPLGDAARVQWYAQARDATGATLASLHSAQAPGVSVSLALTAEAPVVQTEAPRLAPTRIGAIVTAVVSVLAIGGTVALSQVAVASERQALDASRPPGDWADTARATHERANREASAAWGLGIGAAVSLAGAGVLWVW